MSNQLSRYSALELLRTSLRVIALAALLACGDQSITGARRLSADDEGPRNSLSYPTFVAGPTLKQKGQAVVTGGALVITNSPGSRSAAWHTVKQRLSPRWETNFTFKVQPSFCGSGALNLAEGFAFVIQNTASDTIGTVLDGEIGFKGIPKALAVEFDFNNSGATFQDADENHIAVETNGTLALSATVSPLIYQLAPVNLKDGNTHSVRITYLRPTMELYVDGSTTPLFTVNVDLTNINGASILDANGAAWVGFTGESTADRCAKTSILSWGLVEINNPPNASAGGPYTVNQGTSLDLTASATDPDGDAIASYDWDFNNDGITDLSSPNATVQRTFVDIGTVPVSVVAVDPFGARSAPSSAQVTVNNVAPSVTASSAQEAISDQTISVSAAFSDPGTNDGPWSYSIDFGDGSTPTAGTAADMSQSLAASHAYANARTAPYVVTISVTDKNGAVGSATTSVHVTPIPVTITLGNLTQSYNGSPHAVSVTTNPAGVAYDLTYNGSATAPTNAGSYSVQAQVTDPKYMGSASGTLVIQGAPATIQLSGLTGHVYNGSPQSASATISPAGIAFSLKYNGSLTAPTDAGTYTVVAAVTDPNYSGSASGTMVVAKAQASLALDQLAQNYDGTPKSARVTTSPAGLTVVTVTYNGSTQPPRDVGSYAVVASLSNTNYDAPDATGTLVINGQVTQTINFAPLPPRTYGDAPFTVSATGGASGNPVTFTLASNSVGCALLGSTVTITGATADGQACSIVAHQAGGANYLPAPDVTQSFAIARATPRIYWRPATKLYYGAALGGAHLNAVALGVGGVSLGGTYSYTPAAGTVLEVGMRTLSVSFQPSNANYKPVSASVTIQVAYLPYPGHRFLEPLAFRPVFNQGQPIDVAFQLFYSDGWRPVTNGHATIEVRRLIGLDQLGEPISLGVEPAFVYNAGKQRYEFRLRTDNLDAGRYRVIAKLDDGCDIAVTIEIRHGGGRDHTDGSDGLRPVAPSPSGKKPGYVLPPRWVWPRS
jgi:hypothetical protein